MVEYQLDIVKIVDFLSDCTFFSVLFFIAHTLRALNNKWLRWKYADELRVKEMKWLETNKAPDMGWAVGRRIYEKDEIEVSQNELFNFESK